MAIIHMVSVQMATVQMTTVPMVLILKLPIHAYILTLYRVIQRMASILLFHGQESLSILVRVRLILAPNEPLGNLKDYLLI